MTDVDYDSILDELERHENLSLNKMLVLIVMINTIDDNNNSEIFIVVLHYIIIKYKYVNIIWIFIFFLV